MALVALLLFRPAGAQTPQRNEVGPDEAGVQSISNSSSDASSLALALARRGFMHQEAVGYDRRAVADRGYTRVKVRRHSRWKLFSLRSATIALPL